MIKITVPATSANLGIGYDTLGMAVSLYSHFTFERADELTITGCPDAGSDRVFPVSTRAVSSARRPSSSSRTGTSSPDAAVCRPTPRRARVSRT